MTGGEERSVHFVVPEGFDDPRRVSGGNVFDRHVAAGLSAIGWDVRTDAAADVDGALSRRLDALPDGALVLIDGLVAGRAPDAVEEAAERLRVVVLAHMVRSAFPDADPRAVEDEGRALRAAAGVIATSEWTRSELVRRERIPPERIVVATPGSDDAPAAEGTATGAALLCVGVVAPHKGQDVLIEALRMLDADLPWTCTIAGSLTAFPRFAQRIRTLAADAAFDGRVRVAGVLTDHELDEAYRRADLVVAPSRVESYGMAVADALRRGIPVVATAVGGLVQTVSGSGAAVLVPPDRPEELSEALRSGIVDPVVRARRKGEALRTRSRLPRWSDTVKRVGAALAATGILARTP